MDTLNCFFFYSIKVSFIIFLIYFLNNFVYSFQGINSNINGKIFHSPKYLLLMQSNTNKKASLNQNSVWKVNLKLQKQGYKDIESALKIRFVSDKNYEPPQGRIFIEDDYQGIHQLIHSIVLYDILDVL